MKLVILTYIWYNPFQNRQKNKNVPEVREVFTNFKKSIEDLTEFIRVTNYEAQFKCKVEIHVDYEEKRFTLMIEPLWSRHIIEHYQPNAIQSDETFGVAWAGYSLSVVRTRTNTSSSAILISITNFCDEKFFSLNLGRVYERVKSANFFIADCALAPRKFIKLSNQDNRFNRFIRFRACSFHVSDRLGYTWPENEPEMNLKWTENGPKMNRKWTGNELKMDQKWTGNEPEMNLKWTGNEPEMNRKWTGNNNFKPVQWQS